jgi:hypothetical protein
MSENLISFYHYKLDKFFEGVCLVFCFFKGDKMI